MVALPRTCERCGASMYHYGGCFACATEAPSDPRDAEIARLRDEGIKLRRLAALAVNQLSGGSVFDQTVTGTQLREAALRAGLFALDDLHHAPACPANHFHQMRLPSGRCTCGTVAHPR